MTAVDIIGLQRRMRQLGEIRIGHTVDTGRTSQKTGRPILRPAKLDKFRLTSASRYLLEQVADLYGGTVQPWTPANGGPQEWEVYTETDRLPVIVPPDSTVRPCFELYKGSRCVRRCDGRIEEKTDRACMCDPDDRTCTITTRLNVMLRDVPGLGLWLLTSHGQTAAETLPPIAEFLSTVGGYVDAWLGMEEVSFQTEINGKVETVRYMVPTLDVDITPAQLLAGGGVAQAALAAKRTQAVEGQQAPAIAAPAAAPAGEPTPTAEEFVARAAACESLDDLTGALQDAWRAGFAQDMKNSPDVVGQAFLARRAELEADSRPARPDTEAPAEPGGRDVHLKAALAAQTMEELSAALTAAQAAGFARNIGDPTDEVAQAFIARRRVLDPPPPLQSPQTAKAEADAERIWSEIVQTAGSYGVDRLSDIEIAFAARWDGDPSATATARQLQIFLDDMQAGRIPTITPATSTAPASPAAGSDEEVPF